MTTEPTVIARLRGTTTKPHFTQPRPISELIELLYKQLSVDKVYFVDTAQGDDGSYLQQLTEAGSFIIQFLPSGEKVIPPVPTKPEVVTPPVADSPLEVTPSSPEGRNAPIAKDNDQPIGVATPTRNNRNLTPSRSSNDKRRKKIRTKVRKVAINPEPVIATNTLEDLATPAEYQFGHVAGPLNGNTKHKTQVQLLAEKGIIETPQSVRAKRPSTLKGPMFN